MNVALDWHQRSLTRRSGEPWCRFHRTTPTASIGAHEAPRHALRLAYCRDQGIPIVRRLTGGGALYLDPNQLHWTATWPRRHKAAGLDQWLRRIGETIASGLRSKGVPARAAWPNDLEVDGRKLGIISLRLEPDVVTAYGSLLVDIDAETMLKVLRVPREKLSPEGLATARERLVTANELVGHREAWQRLRHGVIDGLQAALGSAVEERPYAAPQVVPLELTPAPQVPSAWEAFATTRAGVLYATVSVREGRVEMFEVAGALHVTPPDLLTGLGAHVRGIGVETMSREIHRYLTTRGGRVLDVSAEDVARAAALALARGEQCRRLALGREEANTLMVHDPDGDADVPRLLGRCEVVLVPYCAKPTWCKWRHREGCPECGQCEVGEVYRRARERGLEAITIGNFEHLRETLARLSLQGVRAYMGMCCSNFYIKREYVFREAGIPAVLMDISGSNCYEMREEGAAYRGEFQAQAELNGRVVEQVMKFVPPSRAPLPRRRSRRDGGGNRA
ncbi:MAG TPA: hypothetical protein VKA32_08935 [Gammaproteobacteria bacterium]|nr:hypothetical protein [Gammaproteobacteria bacterium]